MKNRPWRPEFFRAFVVILSERSSPLRILELGSGPGHLAAALLKDCQVRQYVALDFSSAMHALARKHLGPLAAKIKFVERDFRNSSWNAALGKFDAVITLQAAHETRHRDRLPRLMAEVRTSLKPGGIFLYGDHYYGSRKNPALFLERQEQSAALKAAGFVNIRRLLDKGGMALYRALA